MVPPLMALSLASTAQRLFDTSPIPAIEPPHWETTNTFRTQAQIEDGLEMLWSTRIGSEVRAPPVVDGEQVFVRSTDGRLRSLSARDGSQQWQVSQRVPALSLTGNSMPVVFGDAVIVGADDGKLVAYDRNTAKTLWETTISQPRGRTEVERLVDLDAHFVLRPV